MKTQLIVKTDREVKIRAQRTAKELGLSLSAVIGSYLKEFIREQKVTFSVEPQLRPEVGRILKEASADFKKGKNISPLFHNVEDAIHYLRSK
ncbi:MAG: hypothetical protein A2544_01860 [Candidatus Zambryskibacteria bacterium RIFOXYD2_FULL_43_10]|uniref:Damage-inducible protein J n=1 Tax=Candidatus Zambryskibacteria bacterium RIFOXYD2_FULL_43_10 TaxID=1802782 RepID=A0A1G2V877_9BACT|nr:MAG: hypothetical protein A2544_01860 [Candidatus Zambryskibacteria bacterium RIFOXYD2_FULL_43_10]